jgi:hypothetical protein
MAGWLVLAWLVPTLLLTTLVVVVVGLMGATPSSRVAHRTVTARRHAVTGGTVAVALAVVVTAALVALGTGGPRQHPPGLLAVLAVLGGALAHTLVLALTELTWPRPDEPVRRARLGHRGLRDVLGHRGAVLLAVATSTLLAALGAGTALAGPDGRSVSRTTASTSSSAGPFPGSAYAGPVAVLLGLTLLTALVTLRLVLARPAVEGADDATDSALRRASAHRVVRGLICATTVTAGALALVGGLSASHVAVGGLHALAVAVAGVGALLVPAGLGALCVRAPGVPEPVAAGRAPVTA